MKKTAGKQTEDAAKLGVSFKNETILVVEDSREDALLLQRVFRQAGFANKILVLENVDEAIAFLKGEGQYANRTNYPLPGILLLDIHLPRKNGFELLQWIATARGLDGVLLVAISDGNVSNINRAYQSGAHSYLTKPFNTPDLLNLVSLFEDWRLKHNRRVAPRSQEALQS